MNFLWQKMLKYALGRLKKGAFLIIARFLLGTDLMSTARVRVDSRYSVWLSVKVISNKTPGQQVPDIDIGSGHPDSESLAVLSKAAADGALQANRVLSDHPVA